MAIDLKSIYALPERLKKALLIIFIGVVIGLVEFAITTVLATVVNGKFSLIQGIVDKGKYGQWIWLFVVSWIWEELVCASPRVVRMLCSYMLCVL